MWLAAAAGPTAVVVAAAAAAAEIFNNNRKHSTFVRYSTKSWVEIIVRGIWLLNISGSHGV